jgi:aminoglycoside phosphotransferase (APT) family kinase protein
VAGPLNSGDRPIPQSKADTGQAPGVDLAALSAYLASRVPIVGPLVVSLIHGGRSNLTYRLSDGVHDWVLRRPPLGSILPTAHDMAREYRVIEAVHGKDVPVPAPVLFCQDRTILGVEFYLMEYVEGIVVRNRAQAAVLGEQQAARCADELVQVLAGIHRVDTSLLSGLGRPDGYLSRQVSRWQRQWALSATRTLPEIYKLAQRLAECVPQPQTTSLVHGDYRLDNVIFRTRGAEGLGEIAAVVDWEMATLGDPLADLGLLLVYWDPLTAGVTGTEHAVSGNRGFPPPSELANSYARATGLSLRALGFYAALGYFKLAVIAEGIHARFLAGRTVGRGFETVGDTVPALVAAGLGALATG